jgi:hypothetical protein
VGCERRYRAPAMVRRRKQNGWAVRGRELSATTKAAVMREKGWRVAPSAAFRAPVGEGEPKGRERRKIARRRTEQERGEAFYPPRATTTAADSKRDCASGQA